MSTSAGSPISTTAISSRWSRPEALQPVQPEESVVIPFDGESWAVKETDAPAG